jgi:hypothetical protein
VLGTEIGRLATFSIPVMCCQSAPNVMGLQFQQQEAYSIGKETSHIRFVPLLPRKLKEMEDH